MLLSPGSHSPTVPRDAGSLEDALSTQMSTANLVVFAMETCCSSPLIFSSLPGRLQSHDGFLPILCHGQLLLAPGGRAVSSHPAGHLLLFREEVLLVVHLDWLGYASSQT